MENQIPEGSVPLAESVSVGSAPAVPDGKLVPVARQPVTIKLEDGRLVGMAKPKGSLTEAISSILAGKVFGSSVDYESERARVKALLYITDIDGVKPTLVFDKITRAKLEEEIGDEYLDQLTMLWAEHFPPGGAVTLEAVKKS